MRFPWSGADKAYYGRVGGEWVVLWSDTGWQPIAPASGFTSVGAQVRRIGSVVYLRGRLDGTVSTGVQNHIGTVPVGFRPAGGADNAIGAVHVSAFSNNTFWGNVNAAGEIRVIPTASGTHAMRLKGLSGYTTD